MTTIHVKEGTWKKLNQLKRPGETMDDVVKRLLHHFEMNRISDAEEDVSDFDTLLDEFIQEQKGIEETVEKLRKSWVKEES